ncbi:MAG: class I SAM-dependent methyltransferase [Desulfobacteraceae bacterium]|nr:class I SAM-dependent methyltransferase [Desulfobacteraceae bacterium]
MSSKFGCVGFQLRQKLQKIYDYIRWAVVYKRCPIASKQFSVHGKLYPYFVHYYNQTWANERAVEIPIVQDILNSDSNGNILEIGNVFSHYFPVRYDVIDKYERFGRTDIIKEDIAEYQTTEKYDLIVSISTIEHVGWDELPRDPDKIFLVIEKSYDLLAENGKAVFTIPVGYNPHLDRALRTGKIQFCSAYCLKRINKQNEWTESDLTSVLDCEYGKPFPNANGLVIAFIYK